MKHTVLWTLATATALTVGLFALFTPPASAGDDVLNMEGCVVLKSADGNVTLVKMGDNSLVEVDMRPLNSRDKREQNTDPGQCFLWDLEPTPNKKPTVFANQGATWTAETTDIGREDEDQPLDDDELDELEDEDEEDDDD